MARYQPGDIVSRRKGIVMHKGIALPDGRILHNSPLKGEHTSSEAEFRAGKRLHVTRLESRQRARALRATENDSARRYNLFTNNCEHTVNRATSGRAHSPQLQGWLAGAGIAALTFAITRHPGAAVAGYAFGRGLASRLRSRSRR